MDDTQRQLDEALEKLLAGEELSALQQAYPQHATELASYAVVHTKVVSLAAQKPSEESLRRALSSMRAQDARTMQEPTYHARVTAFFGTYRAILVLPVLVLMLVATGVAILPTTSVDTTTPPQQGVETSSGMVERGARFVANDTEVASQVDGVSQSMMLMKAAPDTAPMSLPEDQELSSVFAGEMQHDRAVAQSSESETVATLADEDSLTGYENTYDAETL